MPFNPFIHNRRSIRLRNYDYSQNGAYFVTICVNKRLELLGNIVGGEMMLNDAGMMVDKIIYGMPDYNNGVIIDDYIIMPNHIHAIIIIENDVGATHCGRPNGNETTHCGRPNGNETTHCGRPK